MLVFEHCEALVCGERDIHGIARMVGGGGLIGGDKAAWSAKGAISTHIACFSGCAVRFSCGNVWLYLAARGARLLRSAEVSAWRAARDAGKLLAGCAAALMRLRVHKCWLNASLVLQVFFLRSSAQSLCLRLLAGVRPVPVGCRPDACGLSHTLWWCCCQARHVDSHLLLVE